MQHQGFSSLVFFYLPFHPSLQMTKTRFSDPKILSNELKQKSYVYRIHKQDIRVRTRFCF